MPTVTLRQVAKYCDDDTVSFFMRLTDGEPLELDEATIVKFVDIDELALRVIPPERGDDYMRAARAADCKQEEENDKLREHKNIMIEGLGSWWRSQVDQSDRTELHRRWEDLTKGFNRALKEIGLERRATRAKALLEILNQCSST